MHLKSLMATAAAGALLLPAAALGANGQANGHAHARANATPGPHASTHAKRKAYGYLCQDQSREHVAGQRGTPFSACVTAMAKAATGKADNPTTACKALSKKHVKGEKGTPYSQCVSSAAKLLRSTDGADATDTGDTNDTGDTSDTTDAS